ncbi:Hypothetical protein CINCED_3A014047 [Cinara cedri]|uniref:Uncharacterized protein n=1 Tax=Cinara cedri TaxID=506608 RepID=A0A5E4MHE4_9HEMI|nr:Hypothetical protein CINCED_3A014047 [Cinara cedri]
MNPMRLFILLAFILYETQCAESFKHLKFLKSLLASKLLATEQSNFEEEIPYIVNKCELTEGGCNDGTVVELNNPSYPTNENPILIENQYTEMSSGNPEDFPVENSGNPEDFPVENSGNSEANPEKEYENVYDKDMNTEWLLGENINVNQPSDTSTLSSVTASVPDNTNHDTLKSKLQNKINAIRTKIQLISQKIKPVNEIIPNDSEVVYEENYSTTESTTSTEAKPITTKEPAIITVSSTTYTEEPINTENPIAVEPDVQVNVEAQKPIVSIIPAQNNTDLFKNQIYVSPYALWVNDCPPPPHQQVNYQPNFQYAANPLFATKQWTLANTPYTWPVYQNQQNIKFAASGPINTEGHIQWYNPYNANPVYSNPISSSVYQGNGPAALFKPTVSVSEVSSFSSTARPIYVIAQADAPMRIHANTYADKPLEFNNEPFGQLTYGNKRLSYEAKQVVNNLRVGANQATVPEQANQGINFQQYAENIPFYTAETSGSVVPSAGIAYSSPSTARPIDVITPVDAPSLTYANTYADKPLKFNNAPFRQPTYDNQRLNFGTEQAVNNFRVGANQATVPEQANQWINFQQVNSKPQQYAENIPSYIAGPYGSMVPNAGIPYSSPSTARSNNMYSTDAPILTSANPNVAKPLPNTGYNPNYQLKYQNQKPKILTVNREVNDFKVGTNQSIIPERTNQWIYLNQANSNPLYTNPITPSISQKIRPTASIKPVVSNSGVKYFSSSTARPIDVSAPTNAPNPIPANTYTDQRMEFNTAPFKQSAYPNQRLNYGVEQVVNNFEVYTNQPIVPEQVNQRINFEQINSKSQQFPKNVQPYAVEISGSSFPSSSVTYSSSSTGQPIAVYPTDAPNPIPANTYAPKPTTVNYRPNDQPKFYYQKTNIGALSTEVNDFNVGANQPINPEQTNQRINEFEQANSKPQFPEAIISNVPVTSDQNVPSGSIIPSSSVAYSSPVEQLGPVQYPITYDTVSPAEQPNSEDNLNTYSAPVLNNAEQSSYPLRGDILFEDNSGLKDEQQDGIEYTLKQRRYAVPDYDKKPFAKKDVFKKSVSESEIRLNAAATKQTETQTPSVAKVDALVTKAELSKPSNFDNVKSDSKTEIVDVKSA